MKSTSRSLRDRGAGFSRWRGRCYGLTGRSDRAPPGIAGRRGGSPGKGLCRQMDGPTEQGANRTRRDHVTLTRAFHHLEGSGGIYS